VTCSPRSPPPAYGVVGAFAGRRFPQRAFGGVWAGKLRWGRLTHARVQGVLSNPCYAGAYVFGRHTTRRSVHPDGRVSTSTVLLPRDKWPVLIKDHHPGYITWDEFLAHEAKLAANRTSAGARPPREGLVLCQGIIHCGSCGKSMSTRYYTTARAAYGCTSRHDLLNTPTCRSVAASTLDEAVVERLLAALNPEEVALALAAADEVNDRHHRATRAAELAVERARYEADRAERAFTAAEPENRLVARTLETRWETKLAAVAEAEAALIATRDRLPPLPDRASIEALVVDLPGLWHASTTSDRDCKRLLRTLIADVTVLPETDRNTLRIGIRWHTGATDEISAARPVHPGTAKRTPSPAIELICRLGPTTSNDDLITLLNTGGYTTGHGKPFDIKAIQWVRHVYKIRTPSSYAAGELSVNDVAARLGVSTGVVYYWIETAQLDARRGSGNRLCIPWNQKIEAVCRQRIAASGHFTPASRIVTVGGAV
jgi:hypothetical protein